MSRWVITDIHGCYHTLRALIETQVQLSRQDTLYLLGDYINKGPFSKQVIDYLLELQEKGFQLQLLRGNHEQEILNVVAGTTDLATLWQKGGQTFMANFGVEHPADIPKKYLHFFSSLEWYFALEDYLLVHAGFDFSAANPFQPSEALVNIRDYSVDLDKTAGRRVLHGHSPTALQQIETSLAKKQQLHMSLDAGCVYRKNTQQAHLLALNIDQWQWYSQKNIDDSDNYYP